MEELLISKQLKRVRLEKEFTLEELAQRTGLTKGLLSKIENNKVSPPLSTLMKITRALDVSLSDLFRAAEAARRIKVVRQKRHKAYLGTSPAGQVMESLVQEFPDQKFEPVLVTIENPNTYQVKMYEHPGQEFIYVLTGKMKYLFGDEEYIVEAGDSLYFNASMPHGAVPILDEKVRYLSILSL